MTPEASKRCYFCNETKPASEFWKDKRHGLSSRCKPCERAHRRVYYQHMKTTERYKEQQRRNQKLYRARHPEVTRAHSRAHTKKGQLMKDCCETCGGTDRLHMHHPDHSKPLEVVTLCNPCHEVAHHGEHLREGMR